MLRALRNRRNAGPRLRRAKPSSMRALGAGDEADRGRGRGRERQAGNVAAGQETRQVGDNAGRQVTRWLCSQAGTLPGRQAVREGGR